MNLSIWKRSGAELIGTFTLVFGGCGSAVLAGDKIGFAGVALAFGLTVLTMAYALGHISGAHFNPAVTLGMCVAGRFDRKDVLPYIIAQCIGGFIAAMALLSIANGQIGFDLAANGLAANGYGAHSPGNFDFVSCGVAEFVLTFVFIFVIAGATDPRAPKGFAPIAIGLALTLVHLIGIPVTNLSVNPARSTGPALILQLFGGADGSWAIGQLWFFWVVPVAAAILAGVIYRILFEEK